MTTFVLVHGAWHGARAWYEVVPRLEARGHTAITLDLPAHGSDLTPPHDVDLDAHADRVEEILDEQDEQVVLVGHSMGGTAISQVAERRPDDVETLVYPRRSCWRTVRRCKSSPSRTRSLSSPGT